MKIDIGRWVATFVVVGLMAASAAPQSGPGGKRGPGGGGGGGGSQGPSGGGGSREPGGGGGGQSRPRETPPPDRTPSRREPGGGGGGGGGTSFPTGGGGTREPGNSGGGGGGSRGGGSGDNTPIIRGGTRPTNTIPSDGPESRGTRPQVTSRSGHTQYGTVNNSGTRGNVQVWRNDRAPIIIDNGVLGRRVDRSENVRVIVNGRGYRVGYYHYNPRWCDDWFVYPYYIFDPWGYQRTCYVSPWYYYVSIPAYIDSSRVIIVGNFPSRNWVGIDYTWGGRGDWDRRDDRDLDYALQDLQDAFERQDRRSANRLIPRSGRVNIYTDNRYSYSLNADDFYDLFMDGLFNAQTRRYEITRVQLSQRGDSARVTARHETTDPWGNPQVVYHTFFLDRDGRDFVIREFGTSIDNGRW